jgi:hypothetical protein
MVRGCCKEGVPVAEPGLTVLVGHERVEGPPADTGNCPGETAFERCLTRSPLTSAPSAKEPCVEGKQATSTLLNFRDASVAISVAPLVISITIPVAFL